MFFYEYVFAAIGPALGVPEGSTAGPVPGLAPYAPYEYCTFDSVLYCIYINTFDCTAVQQYSTTAVS